MVCLCWLRQTYVADIELVARVSGRRGATVHVVKGWAGRGCSRVSLTRHRRTNLAWDWGRTKASFAFAILNSCE